MPHRKMVYQDDTFENYQSHLQKFEWKERKMDTNHITDNPRRKGLFT